MCRIVEFPETVARAVPEGPDAGRARSAVPGFPGGRAVDSIELRLVELEICLSRPPRLS